MIKRIIFDIDGTLIRGVTFNKAIDTTLKNLGLYTKERATAYHEAVATYELFHYNYNLKDYANYLSEKLKIELPNNFLDCLFKELKYVIPNDKKEIESINKTLEYLSKKYELVLLSNYFEKSQRDRLETMGINKYFKEFYGEKIIKPNKDVYMESKGKYEPNECLIIGDNIELDIKTPKKLGFNVILITKEKKEYEDITTINNISDLKDIL